MPDSYESLISIYKERLDLQNATLTPKVSGYNPLIIDVHYRNKPRCGHTLSVSQKDLSKDFKIGKASVEQWYHKQHVLSYKKIDALNCPTVLGIDES